MTIHEGSTPYTAMLRPLAESYAEGASSGTSPRNAARFVLELTALDDPPLRVPLGDAAFDRLLAADNRRVEELLEWEWLSRSADR